MPFFLQYIYLSLINDFLDADDPYFYLYYGKAPRTPSYFALEKMELPETGRVLRFDSFSKVLSAGMRLGFASGPNVIIEAIERHVSSLLCLSHSSLLLLDAPRGGGGPMLVIQSQGFSRL